MKTRSAQLILIVVLTAMLCVSHSAYAQSSQVSSNVSLTHLNVQLTYPAQVRPGQPVTVNVQAKAKNSFKLGSLVMEVYFASLPPGSLRQLTSATVVQDLSMLTGDQVNKVVQLTVPQDAPRTSLIARVSENVTMTIFIIYNNASPSVQPAPYYSATSDDAVTTLTYIEAETPEYLTLLAQDRVLQAQFKEVQQTLNQTQSTVSQYSVTINELTQQLIYANRRTQTYQILAVGLGILAAALAVFSVYRGRLGKKRA